MANPGNGNKFVSVNLNKSFGQSSRSSPNATTSQVRQGYHVGGGGEGMVVLWHRNSVLGAQKGGTRKLSVPPPLNLPSFRKEHECFDASLSGSNSIGAGSSCPGSRASSSGMGWMKPGPSVPQEKDGGNVGILGGGVQTVDGGVYIPPSARSDVVVGPPVAASPRVFAPVVLKGEDFPSLQATLPASSSGPPSQKQKQKQKVSVEASGEQMECSVPQMEQSSHLAVSSGSSMVEQSRKQDEYFSSPLPLVRLNHTSDWADDERDTGHGLQGQGQNHGLSRIRNREFGSPRGGVLDCTLVHDDESGKISSREALNGNFYGRDVRTPSREDRDGSSWRASPISDAGPRSSNPNRETKTESKYSQFPFPDNVRDSFGGGVSETQDSRFGRRDSSYGQGGRHKGMNYKSESFRHGGAEQNMQDQYGGGDISHRYGGNNVHQNNVKPKTSGSLGSKGLPLNDPILNFGREKRSFSNSGRPYLENPFLKDFGGSPVFNERGPFSGAPAGIFKRKKDVLKQVDFHDPIRESFEAELERVQKMQEQERQGAMEEQARALELVRKEEEERERLAREVEGQQRRIEEEVREAAWRAEKERLEAIQRAEELKMAREEEKRRICLEEERRKEAAKQKLLELEARIARKKSEAMKDDNVPAVVKEKDICMVADVGDWEGGERMVERITSCNTSSDSSCMTKSFKIGSRPHSSRDGNTAFQDRGKPANSWRRGLFETENRSTFLLQDQENGSRRLRNDAFGGGRAFKGGIPEPNMVDEYSNLRGHRWNPSRDEDNYGRNSEIGPEFHDNSVDKLDEMGWGQGRLHGGLHASYPEGLYQNSDGDGYSSFGRSRHSVRQPRVLPPPSVSSMHRNTFRTRTDRSGSSAFLDSEMTYHHEPKRTEPTMQMRYNRCSQERNERSGQANSITQEKLGEKATTPGCDSQSSLSVSSPPNSPIHLSQYDSGDSQVLATSAEGKEILLSDNENGVSVTEEGNMNMMADPNYVSPVEEEEWTVEGSVTLQEQEEYDEEEDGYHEDDEVHGGDDENIDLTHEFEDLHLEEKDASEKISQMILGFNDGVQVGIPSFDEFERSPRNGEKAIEAQQVSVGISEEPGSFDGLVGNVQGAQPDKNSPEVSAEASSGSIIPDQQPITSSVNMTLPSPSVQPVMSMVSTVLSQAEVPIKLQFGLFSGPSLIPPPVPAIQIGSIQMPLHVHPHVGPSLSQIHPSQPPFFQFGQLHYIPPISPRIFSSAPQSMSFVQPNVPSHLSLNQNQGDLHNQVGPNTSSQDTCEVGSLWPLRQGSQNVQMSESQAERSLLGKNELKSESISLDEDQVHSDISVKKRSISVYNNTESRGQAEPTTSAYFSKALGPISNNKGKRFIYTIRGSGSRSSVPVSDDHHTDSSGFQRRGRRNFQQTEFRVRQNMDKRHPYDLVSSNYELDEKSNLNVSVSGISARNGDKKDIILNKPSKHMVESKNLNSGSMSLRVIDSESKVEKGGSRRSSRSEGEFDAPLQSGVVRVFKQLGIEAPIDESDFIEVRSKRQMLNDRRERKEKEIKAKARVIKAPRKPRSVSQSSVVSTNSNKQSILLGGEAANNTPSESIIAGGRDFANVEVSASLASTVSQALPPIGTPTHAQSDIRSHTIKSLWAGIIPVVSSGGTSLAPGRGLSFENKNVALDNVPTSLGSWGNAHINQQVMALTQTQLDDAMKPTQFDTDVSHVGDHTNTMSEPSKLPPHILAQETLFSSSSSALNSLLAREKIKFGAVTSPIILPPSSHAVSNVVGAPVPFRSDVSVDQNLFATQSNCSLFFEKERHPNESFVHLEDAEAEAEAEAAASAVAVAAISSDEIAGNGRGASSASVSDTKSFRCADMEGLTSGGVMSEQQLANRASGDESLTISLPADLAVETPSLSLWTPLPSPQSSTNQMLSHFPGASPSHFPCYDMNHMLRAPIFAFGPPDESSGTQSQSQKSSTFGSGALAAWQQCPSGVDSFYGPPEGFTGPFISPPGSIPGVQGPPHVVVYNHFAPVGQFGPVGLSFMGTTYIPSGKQPDWKHTPPASSATGVGEGDTNTLDVASVPHNPPSMLPIQHLAPGSPFLPMASPLAMFDMSPFQSCPDMPVQARWTHVPASPLHSVPMSMPLQQHAEGILSSKFSHGLSLDQPSNGSGFCEPCSSASTDSGTKFSDATTAAQFPDELGLVESSSSSTAQVSTTVTLTSYGSTNGNSKVPSFVRKSSSSSTVANAGENVIHNNVNIGGNSSSQSMNSAFKDQSSQQQNSSTQQFLDHRTGYMDQRGISQKVVSGGEWTQRRMVFRGKSQSLGTDKSFASSKVKQIYVPKPAMSGTKSAS